MLLTTFTKSASSISSLVRLLRAGQVVAAPTETAYGLLADATNTRAVREVLRLKGRKGRNKRKPIALVAADLSMVRRYFRMTSGELQLARAFWPGPLTLLLQPRRKFPPSVIGKVGRVGVRVPRSTWLRSLLKRYGKPLTATSANRASGPTPYSAVSVIRQLARPGLCYLVDGGRLPRRPTSTVVTFRQGKLHVVREGAIPSSKPRRVLG